MTFPPRWRQLLLAIAVVVAIGAQDVSLFFPRLSDVNLWDEAQYVDQGRSLRQDGHLPKISRSPATAVFHAATTAVFSGSTQWLLFSVRLGRVILALLLCLSFQVFFRAAGHGLKDWHASVLLAGTPVLDGILTNTSNALYAILACCTVIALLRLPRTGRLRDLALPGALAGCAALTRADGFFLFAVVAIPAVLLLRPQRRLAAVAMTALSFLAVTGVAYVGAGVTSSTWAVGINDRSYVAFRQGHYFTYEKYYRYEWQANTDVQKLYGTHEENRGSVLRAVLRNPGASWRRFAYAVSHVYPKVIRDSFGYGWPLLALLAVVGCGAFGRGGARRLLAVLLLIPVPLAVYTVTFLGKGYVQQNAFAFFALVTAGALIAVRTLDHVPWLRRGRLAPALLIAACLVSGAVARRLDAAPGGCGVNDPARTIVDELHQAFPPGARIVSVMPGTVRAARMRFIVHPVLRDTAAVGRWLDATRPDGFVLNEQELPTILLRDRLLLDTLSYRLLTTAGPYRLFKTIRTTLPAKTDLGTLPR
jgi:hypothetical protein